MNDYQDRLLPGFSLFARFKHDQVAIADRLALRWQTPLEPRTRQKPLNIGLFDEDARNQLDLFLHTDTL